MNKTIGIVSAFNPKKDKKAHSGILYQINKSIENAGFDTIWIKNPLPFMYKWISRILSIYNRLPFKNIYFDRTYVGAKLLASTIDYKMIEQVNYLMVIHYFHVPAYGHINKPIIYHSDATFELANNYYLKNMAKWNQRQAEKIEFLALSHSTWHLSPSQWREDSVIKHYFQNENRCFVLEYGSCLDTVDDQKEDHQFDPIKMLFMGVNWVRKGGNIAVETCELLKRQGINVILYVVGIKSIPKECRNKDYINFVGYLNKNDKIQYHNLINLIKQSDLFILPTRAECAGVVFCEVSQFGIPIITYDTGGISNYVVNGLNGYRISKGGDAKCFATIIENIIKRNEWSSLSEGSIRMVSTKLNWNNWSKWFKENLN